MNKTNHDVQNQNVLQVRYDGSFPYFQVPIDTKQWQLFKTDHRIELQASYQEDSSLKLMIICKTFCSSIRFNTVLPLWEKGSLAIRRLLSSIISSDTLKVIFASASGDTLYEKSLPVLPSVREACKYYIGEFSSFDSKDDLKETFEALPIGFLAPYATPSYFLLSCKAEDALFEQMKFAPHEDILLEVSVTHDSIVLYMTFHGRTFSSLTIGKDDLCEEILEDFQVLLQQKKVHFAITSPSMLGNMYLDFSKVLNDNMYQVMDNFFQTPYYQHRKTSL